MQCILNVLVFNIQLSKGQKDKNEGKWKSAGPLSLQKSLQLEGYGLALIEGMQQ